MKMLLAADGSEYTQKALEFLVSNKRLLEPADELLVIYVQTVMPTIFNMMVSVEKALEVNELEAKGIFAPIQTFLEKNGIKYRTMSAIGSIAKVIVDTAEKEHVSLILMGTHGRDVAGQVIMGSVAQKVVANSSKPVLLVK